MMWQLLCDQKMNSPYSPFKVLLFVHAVADLTSQTRLQNEKGLQQSNLHHHQFCYLKKRIKAV